MSTISSLLTALRPQHRYLLALTIKNGLWGDCDYEFLNPNNEFETVHALGYITNDIAGGGRRISAMFKAIYSLLCDDKGCGQFLSHASDWWGDGSGDVLFIRYNDEHEWTQWADNELAQMDEATFLSLIQTKRGGRREGSGRKRVDGTRHMWTIPSDIEAWAKEYGTEYLWEIIRSVLK